MERWNKSKAVKKEEEFEEEEIWASWAVGKEREISNSNPRKFHNSSAGNSNSNSNSSSRIPNLSKKYSSKYAINCGESSAPLRIPDSWSLNNNNNNNSNHYNNMGSTEEINNDYEVDKEEEEEMVPPHEIVAKRVARSPIVSFSMCEGVGRTLKGRDLSKLRNSILTKTGFLE